MQEKDIQTLGLAFMKFMRTIGKYLKEVPNLELSQSEMKETRINPDPTVNEVRL